MSKFTFFIRIRFQILIFNRQSLEFQPYDKIILRSLKLKVKELNIQ